MQKNTFRTFAAVLLAVMMMLSVLPVGAESASKNSAQPISEVKAEQKADTKGIGIGTTYNYTAAAQYGYDHAYDDPEYSGGDCANFTSHCLAAGGVTVVNNSSYYSYYTQSYENNSGYLEYWTNPYTCAAAQLLYLSEYYVIITNPSYSQIELGDLVWMYSDWNDGHVAIITGFDGSTPLYSAHTTARRNYPLGTATYVAKMRQPLASPYDDTDPNNYPTPPSGTYLNVGDSGNYVKWLQACLCQLGYNCSVDGQFGSGTETALSNFQSAYGLTVDGGFGPECRAKILELLTVATPSITKTAITGGAKITISCSTSGSTIYYTTNGNTPTTSSTKYTGTFNVTSTKTIKAIAVKSCRFNSSVKSVTATIYTVTFKDWDGTTLKTQNVLSGNAATAPSNPTRTGYTFTGWDKTFSNVTSNLTVTAQYTINKYTVTFKDWDGTVLKTQTVNYGSSATPPANPTWEGHTFTGWIGTYTNVMANQIVTAAYDVNIYTVNYYLDGELYTTENIAYGSEIILPSVEIEGYTFSGWTLENGDEVPAVMPAHDLSVFGTNTRNYVTVTYTGAYNAVVEVPYGTDAELPVLEVEGVHYTFTVNDEAWDGTNLTEDVTVTVGMDINVYTVVFYDPIDDSVIDTQYVEHGLSAEAPAALHHYGYTFDGWDNDFSFVTSDMTVTAVYHPINFTVIFMDGLDNVIDVQQVPYLSAATAPADPEREGYYFAGWDIDFSCVEHDLVVNATWTRIYCTVTYTGLYTGEDIVEYGGSVILPVYSSNTLRYTFTVDGEPWDGTNITSDVTVTVGIEIITYTVTFVDMDGTVLKVQTGIRPGQDAEAPEPPEHEGYTFVDWDTDFTNVQSDLTVTAIYEQNEPAEPDLLGDVDGDGLVTMADVTLLSMYLNGENPEITAEGMLNADANADGTVDIRDIAAIYQIIANS